MNAKKYEMFIHKVGDRFWNGMYSGQWTETRDSKYSRINTEKSFCNPFLNPYKYSTNEKKNAHFQFWFVSRFNRNDNFVLKTSEKKVKEEKSWWTIFIVDYSNMSDRSNFFSNFYTCDHFNKKVFFPTNSYHLFYSFQLKFVSFRPHWIRPFLKRDQFHDLFQIIIYFPSLWRIKWKLLLLTCQHYNVENSNFL